MVAAEAKVLFQSNSLLLRNLDLRLLRKYDPKENRNKAIPDRIKRMEVTEVIEN